MAVAGMRLSRNPRKIYSQISPQRQQHVRAELRSADGAFRENLETPFGEERICELRYAL